MEKRFIIREIKTKKTYRLNNRWAEFNSFLAAKDFLSWMPFNLGNYYEVYDNEEFEVVYTFVDHIHQRRKRR